MAGKGLNLAAKPFVPPGSSPDTPSDDDKSSATSLSNRVASRMCPASSRDSPLWDVSRMASLTNELTLPPQHRSGDPSLYTALGIDRSTPCEGVYAAFVACPQKSEAALTSALILSNKRLRAQYDQSLQQ